MSPRLTPQERVSLFSIEAHLIADDPSLPVRMQRLWGMSAVPAPSPRPGRRIPRRLMQPDPAIRSGGRSRAKWVTAVLVVALAIATVVSITALIVTARQPTGWNPHAAVGSSSSGTAAEMARYDAWLRYLGRKPAPNPPKEVSLPRQAVLG